MASKLSRTNSMPDSVKERRLRPLYDLLDAGNCKKVLQEADKLLKKYPTFSCAKVFKALAFMRLGKMDECMSIVNYVFDEVPTDEATLHAMCICYRELDMPEKVCAMYENACRTEKSEDHMTSWFMANVRILDYANQHKVAMLLYKTYSKGVYLLWAVMSLYAKSLILDDPNIGQTITLPLAARMAAKYIDDNPSYTIGDVYLYIMVLFKMGDYAKALTVLENAHVVLKGISYEEYSRLELTCLTRLNDEEKLQAFFERNILHDPENFTYYKKYIEVFGLSKTDHLIKFFTEVAYDETKTIIKTRAGLLAQIVHAQFLMHKNVSHEGINVRQLFIDYFKKYGSKPFFLRDMKCIFKLLRDNPSMGIISTLEQDMKENSGETTNLNAILQWKTNWFSTQFFLKEPDIMADQDKVMECINNMIQTYVVTDDHFKKEGLRIDSRDSNPYEDLLVTSCVILMKTFWSRMGFWTGYYISSDMKHLKLENEQNVVENGVPLSKKPHWYEGEFPIVLSMTLLEYGVENSPHCFPFRMMLGKGYLFCGASEAGLDQVMKLDVKHMQIDSLGYIYISKILASGMLTDSRRVLNHADAFYGSSSRELMENIIAAYKNASWHQVLEFMGFRETMLSSVQSCQVRVEKRLFEFTFEGNSRDQISKVGERETFDIKLAFNSNFEDNRDFRIHSFMNEDLTTESYRRATLKDSIYKLRMRASVLGIITNFVRALTHLNDPTKCKELVLNSKIASDALNQCVRGSVEIIEENMEYRSLFGPWPPTAHEYAESPMMGCLLVFIGFVCNVGSMIYKENSRDEIKDLYAQMKISSKKISDTLDLFLVNWKKVDISLINMANMNEELFLVVESLGFICILTDVLKGLFEKITPPSETKGRKKRSKDINMDAPWIAEYNLFIQDLISNLSCLEEQLTELELLSAEWYAPWSEQENFWKGKVSDTLFQIAKKTLPIVCQKLRFSYNKAYVEMKTNVTRKKQFIETLLVN